MIVAVVVVNDDDDVIDCDRDVAGVSVLPSAISIYVGGDVAVVILKIFDDYRFGDSRWF